MNRSKLSLLIAAHPPGGSISYNSLAQGPQHMNSTLRILIVDDDQFVRSVLRDVLSLRGYECSEAGDGEEALEKMRAQAPDVVLLDLLMPKMCGPWRR